MIPTVTSRITAKGSCRGLPLAWSWHHEDDECGTGPAVFWWLLRHAAGQTPMVAMGGAVEPRSRKKARAILRISAQASVGRRRSHRVYGRPDYSRFRWAARSAGRRTSAANSRSECPAAATLRQRPSRHGDVRDREAQLSAGRRGPRRRDGRSRSGEAPHAPLGQFFRNSPPFEGPPF